MSIKSINKNNTFIPLPQTTFLLVFKIQTMIGFYRLPTHRKKNSMIPAYFQIKIFAKVNKCGSSWAAKG